MDHFYQQNFTITDNCVDCFGRLKPSIILYYVQEVAGRHFDLTRKGEHGQPFADKKISVRGGVARIPFRALVPKGADDIIVAGRCIAADGQALGPARIMSTCMATGEAAGTAAALKVKHGISIRDVDIDELHTILKANGAEFEG